MKIRAFFLFKVKNFEIIIKKKKKIFIILDCTLFNALAPLDYIILNIEFFLFKFFF